MRRWLLLPVTFVLLLAGCGGASFEAADTGGSTWVSCTRNADCPAGQRCEAGLCKAAGTTSCVVDSGCAYGQRCLNGHCVDRTDECGLDGDCTAQPGGVCEYGQCRYEDPLACATDDDCASDRVCEGEPGTCVSACPEGCADEDPCTLDTCTREGCTHGPAPDCCRADGDCDDENPCTGDTCADNACVHIPLSEAGCCTTDGDCDDDRADTVDRCVEYECRHLRPCTESGECDDGDSCTADRCVAGGCVNTWVDGCCHVQADCDDGNDCTSDRCDGGACTHQGVPGCCASDADCDDDDPCTDDTCGDGGTCRNAIRPDCCADDEACSDDVGCTADACVDGTCTHEWMPNCCTTAADCADGDPCTTDLCGAGGLCTNPPVPGCCADASDCDDADPCTIERCDAGACVSDPDPTCCNTDFECEDGNVCTTDRCIEHRCAFPRVPECCLSDADCDDGLPTTTDSCELALYECRHLGIPCLGDAECDDGVPATIDRCDPVSDTCVNELRPSCATAADCDDGDPCSIDVCEQTACRWELNLDPGCRCDAESECAPQESCRLLEFDDGGIYGYCQDAVGDLPMGAPCAGAAASDTCRSGLCLQLMGVWLCFGACATTTDCAAGTTCQPSGLPSGGSLPDHTIHVCLPRPEGCTADGDCAAGEFCQPFIDPDDPGQILLGCATATAGLGRTGDPCRTNAECNTGFCLQDETRGGICFGLCAGDDDCQTDQRCYEGAVTLNLNMGTPETSDDRAVPLPACSWDLGSFQPCVREADCPGAEVCFPLLNAAETAFAPACVRPPDGTTLVPGEVCSASNQCQSGVCVGGLETNRCLQFCVLDADCPTPTTCEAADFTVTRLDGTTASIRTNVCLDD